MTKLTLSRLYRLFFRARGGMQYLLADRVLVRMPESEGVIA
jgi:hypothetical protein